MIERLATGVPGLDEILGGGLPANAINLILGVPGSGKTLLAQQHVFANATAGRPAVYMPTVSEPFEKLVRYGQSLSFFDPDAVGRRVFYEDVGSALLQRGLAGVLDRVKAVLAEYEPGLLVIDSFKPFSSFAESPSAHRQFLYELAARLSVRPMASLWVGEYSAADMPSAPEFAVADAVLSLTATQHEERESRMLQVLKLRGSDFLSGRHAYRLSADGIRVFPRLADAADSAEYRFADGRVSTGAEMLDAILGGGYRPGSATLIAGPPGAGKTVLGLHFMLEGGRQAAPSILATLEENPSQLERAASSFGWSLTNSRIHFMYRSAVDLYLDEWVYDLLELIDATKARRIFIDGLASLRLAAGEPVRFREYIYSLVQRCSRQNVNVVMSLESPQIFGVTTLTDVALSQLADNVILLQLIRSEGRYRRSMTVLKSRAIRTEPSLHEYSIGAHGIEPGRTLASRGDAPP
jgi:circadian clock protein KaiC